MTKETLDTTNKLLKPEDIAKSDDEAIRQLSENLQDITPEDIDAMCDNMDKDGKESWNFVLLSEVDGCNLEFERGKRIVKWKWKTFNLNTQSWEKDFMDEAFWIMKSSDITIMMSVLWEIYGDYTISKIQKYLTRWLDSNFFAITEETL